MTESAGHGNVGLLARLVTVGAIPQPEVAATRSVCYLLAFPALADAFTGLIQSQADFPTSAIDGVAAWRHLFTRMETFSDQPAKSPERARVDLVGFDSEARPRVVIEAKFGAALPDDQVRAARSGAGAFVRGGSGVRSDGAQFATAQRVRPLTRDPSPSGDGCSRICRRDSSSHE